MSRFKPCQTARDGRPLHTQIRGLVSPVTEGAPSLRTPAGDGVGAGIRRARRIRASERTVERARAEKPAFVGVVTKGFTFVAFSNGSDTGPNVPIRSSGKIDKPNRPAFEKDGKMIMRLWRSPGS
ncbi:hypothetical protein GCM10012289_04110 [Nonomuraea cavernae]|uniref:Uncharacterized protein n=1 Tax=Nonomuraea cavernae TaxID=2045107 RepID=A0A917YRI8_9ACTN|nr:hypothetical protein GCM10012289_04110 [Nonomuraea cavernae]